MSGLKPIICPSILSSDFAILAQESRRMEEAGANYLHIDVMDGHFVPNLTLGAPIVKSLRKHTQMFLDCHLMVTDPAFWIKDYAEAGANQVTFHLEATSTLLDAQSPLTTDDAAGVIKQIKDAGMRAGIALKPSTPITPLLLSLIPSLDQVLIMTVEPGFGGQKLMPSTLEKVSDLRARFGGLDIQVDGGIDVSNIDVVAASGANVIVSGTGIFKHSDAGVAVSVMKKAVQAAINLRNK